ncbi:hypothetical protein A3A46_01140 [Candidatus Roizmanbacteria bacterium RIFCSPLOWO2_01_FULL_37_13]|nr:MAG: hypothetical protein A3A46_01140 [Candidatus Roizmanbacteria bacterium RIFCSPLOWO2_01_FULL_37_13]
MIKKFLQILFGITFFLIISNKFTSTVQGQTPTPQGGPAPQSWRCLTSTQVGERTAVPPPEVDVNITGAGFPSLHDIYTVLCVPGATKKNQPAANYQCTTGNSEFDQLVFNTDMTGTIAPLTFEVPKGSNPSQTIQAIGGNLDTVVHMRNADGHVNYAFFGVTINEPSLNSQDRGDTLQYGTFQFEQNPDQCVSIRWDPYGRIFDSQSLEPISNVRVSILDVNKKLVVTQGLLNPQRTEADGQFNFYVAIHPKGKKTYYINPVPPTTHTFTDAPNLHPNYVKAYSEIYKPDEPIIEAEGVPEHRDIPLDPGSNPPFKSTPVTMSLASVNLGGDTRYEGIVSHPISIVTLVGKNSRTEVARTVADKFGVWRIVVPNANIPQNEPLVVKIIKVDLTTLPLTTLPRNFPNISVSSSLRSLVSNLSSFINNKVSAQDTDSADEAEFPPILSYVEGYAYDQDGNVLADATVNVRLQMSDGIYYQTKTDENGFFSILPQNLPIFVYYLEFESPKLTSPVKMTGEEFVEKNQEYLTTGNVNLMAATKDGQSLRPTSPASPTTPEALSPTSAVQPFLANNNLSLILILIAVVVLLGVAGGILMYIKKKQAQTDNLL